jgi:hypothetical protein
MLRKARPRKLNPKAALQCFRYDQINIDADDDSARLAEIDNGVDKGEREVSHCLLSHPYFSHLGNKP